jgi:hypothetical protein
MPPIAVRAFVALSKKFSPLGKSTREVARYAQTSMLVQGLLGLDRSAYAQLAKLRPVPVPAGVR